MESLFPRPISASRRFAFRSLSPVVWLLTWGLVMLPPRPAQAATPLEDNRLIIEGYIQLANEMQSLLDPAFQPGGSSLVRPTWYGFAPHAAHAGGKGMLGAALALRIIDAARTWPSFSVGHALDRAGITGPARAPIASLAQELTLQGLPTDVAASLAALLSAVNVQVMADPRVLLTTASRFAWIYWHTPGFWPLDKAKAIVRTFERTLHESNLAIFSDIGGAGRLYLTWRQAQTSAVTGERVLTAFSIPGANLAEARLAYTYARAHAHDTPRPYQMDQLFPGMAWKSLLLAAFALYEEARVAPTPADRDALIAMGTNYIAWREQHDQAQPVFTPASPRADEVSRSALLEIISPALRTEFGTTVWTYEAFAATQPDRDGNPFTAPATEYNWAFFPDRWAGIMHAFNQVYLQPASVWVMPQPLEDPLALLSGR
ncbi:conserved uncharacterized protein [Stigmatella aurantiaca DW4/3-1]|uniref:Conserved uncharacterized protein n=1 Tax=Stigmatella aurantiaca (strain DW4/3-1) TaxID=378806 RepID=E3FM90_STIAD|nr:hypothetical protein [Stigmatella aurantiaca]ADO69289.1 conserved uncharacterized protein [Stigmatella aurantiaca DW4/3-1]